MVEPKPARVSHERIALASLRRVLEGITEIEVVSGQGAATASGWPAGSQRSGSSSSSATSASRRRRQRSSSRLRAAAGSATSSWPLLAAGTLEKRLVLIHVFRITSAGDYTAHRQLWRFLVERMRGDLAGRGIAYPDAWEAELFTYRPGEEALEAAESLRAAVAAATA